MPGATLVRGYPDDAVLLTYARNNVLHLFALPALVCFLVAYNGAMSGERLHRLAQMAYPFLSAELFLRWPERDVAVVMDRYLDALTQLGWLRKEGERHAAPELNSDAHGQMMLLGQAIRPTLLRYFITLAMLTRNGSGSMTPEELESQCHLHAQRLSLLREFNAPEFFDKAIFRTFIDTLKKTGYASVHEDGAVHFDHRLDLAATDARALLPPDVRQAVL